ncbi:hypothetical protein RUND412_009024 [Rhizina undulata]
MKTYLAGPRDTKTGILVIYDAFRFFPRTIQDPHIIASAGHLTIMPDFFCGDAMNPIDLPIDTPEKQAKLQKFMSGPAAFPINVIAVQNLYPTLQSQFPETKRWAVIGYCWRDKITALVSGKDTQFVASAQIHAGRLDPEEAGPRGGEADFDPAFAACE